MRPLAALLALVGCSGNNLSISTMDLAGSDLLAPNLGGPDLAPALDLSAGPGGGGGLIPKTGTYTGPHNDPMLGSLALCPDQSLEPNETPAQAIPAPSPFPDQATPKITKMAICPTGPRPETGMHDIDFYVVDTTGLATTPLTMMAEIFYDVSYGDLDVGIFDSTLTRLASDGS